MDAKVKVKIEYETTLEGFTDIADMRKYCTDNPGFLLELCDFSDNVKFFIDDEEVKK